jgi:hypothetical protein
LLPFDHLADADGEGRRGGDEQHLEIRVILPGVVSKLAAVHRWQSDVGYEMVDATRRLEDLETGGAIHRLQGPIPKVPESIDDETAYDRFALHDEHRLTRLSAVDIR